MNLALVLGVACIAMVALAQINNGNENPEFHDVSMDELSEMFPLELVYYYSRFCENITMHC
jgi:hypothetical protein